MKLTILSLMLAAGFTSLGAEAAYTVYADRAAFLADTGASSATGAIPDLGAAVYGATLGSVTLTDPDGTYGFFVGGASYYLVIGFDWSPLNPGHDIAINHAENLDVAFAAPVYAAGFDFVEPLALDVNHPYANDGTYYLYVDSAFTVTLKQGAASVGSFQFNAPDGVLSFVGVWSDLAFDRMEIRETTGGIEDDYFGQFYSGTTAMPVPEPETWALMLAGLGLVSFAARRRIR